MPVIDSNTTSGGYRRENGRIGVRNHVIILPLDDLSNAAAEAVAYGIKGTMAIPHPYGGCSSARPGSALPDTHRNRVESECRCRRGHRIEDGWTKRVVDGIAPDRQAGRGLRHRGSRRP
jgi:(2R)-sulfolactate sulfo-lyase subunit beta